MTVTKIAAKAPLLTAPRADAPCTAATRAEDFVVAIAGFESEITKKEYEKIRSTPKVQGP
jgi:hypothetical protein